jgi:hypothetical protein
MRHLILTLVLLLSFGINSNELVNTLNDLILKDLKFNQKTLNFKTNKVENSYGNIRRSNKLITINVESPFKERYKINKDYVEIYDYDFDETKTIFLEDVDVKTLDFLTKGIRSKDIILIENKSLTLKSSGNELYIELIDSKNFVIKFKDNLGLQNLINFEVIS